MSALLLAAALAASDDVELRLASERMELVFRAGALDTFHAQALCLAEAFNCSRDSTLESWKQNLAFTDADQQLINAWGKSLASHQAEEEAPHLELPLAGPARWNLATKVQRAFLSSADVPTLRHTLEVLLNPGDVDALLEPSRVLFPRFLTWWKKDLRRRADLAAKDASAEAKRSNLLTLAAQVRDFYDSPVKGRERIVFHCIPRSVRADEKHPHTSATVLEHDAYVEVLPDRAAKEWLDVALHEVFHAFFAERSTEQHAALAAAFAKNPSAFSPVAHSLLDEGLATALGNGIVAKALISPERFAASLERNHGWYNDDAIDAAGKAWFALLQPQLGHVKLDAALVDQLIRSLAERIGELKDPALLVYARGQATLRDEDAALFAPLNAWRRINTTTNTGNDPWLLDTTPRLSGFVIVRSDDVPKLKDHPAIPDVAQLRARQEGVFGIERDVYVFVGKDPKAIAAQIDRFITARKRFRGWL